MNIHKKIAVALSVICLLLVLTSCGQKELVKLPTPEPHVEESGHLQLPFTDGVTSYEVKNLLTEHILVYNDGDIRLDPNTPYAVRAMGDPKKYLPSDYSEPVQYASETITFSETENTIDNLVSNGDGTYTMVAYSNLGNAYRFKLEGDVTPAANAWGTLGEGAVFFSMDALKGILGFCVATPDPNALVSMSSCYEFDGNDAVDSYAAIDNAETIFPLATGEYQVLDSFPNFIAIDYTSSMETSSTITSVTFYFDGIETVYDHCTDHDYFYDYLWIEGTPYVAPERDLSLRIHYTHNGFSLPAVDYFGTTAVTGLRDANGNVIEDTQNYHVQAGDTLDITLHDGFKTSATFVRDDLDTATNSNEARPTSFSNTVGTMNVIVVPVYWRDQTDRRSDANLEAIYRALGNVIDANGNVTVYTPADPSEPSLSQYYQTASYGKLTVNAFVTEWYSIDATYDEMRDRDPQFDSYDVYQWLYSTYPDMDFSRFDSDRDGILDEVIFINTGDMSGYDSYERFSFAGAFRTVIAYGGYEQPGAGAGLARPVIHHYVNLNLGFLFENMIIGEPANVETSTLIHEFGHTLGLGDYYDTGSKGVSFLGGYDMMDRDVGDWNVYSKYTAGWITPTVVNLNGQASATYTIRSSAIHGDALLIYANGYNYNGTPFDEYLMVDLFTAQGLHEKDSALYNLENSVGVRIYHVNRRMEKSYVDTLDGSVACGRDIFSNDSDNSWNELCGFSELEIIPADGNGFTNRAFTEDCLFVAGDSFRTESYSDFFYNGKMDNGMSLGYEISVTSIDQVNGEYVATITVTAVGN